MDNKKLLTEATQFLMERASLDRAEAHLQARLLLDGITGTRFTHLVAPEATLEPPQREKFYGWLEEAGRGRPIPYILGRAPFWGMEFEVDERVLIPRPETELLVETVLEKLKNRPTPLVADLGTGSGIIAVSLAKARPEARVVATDISPGALEVAQHNASKQGVNIEWVAGGTNWLDPVREIAPFDTIVSNPPYIAPHDIEELEIGVRLFEPRLALDGGPDGLDPYREMAVGAMAYLKEDGFLAVELGAGQFADLRLVFEVAGWIVEPPRLDLAGIERVLVASHG
jgi:release factor glutamine methyltransferase